MSTKLSIATMNNGGIIEAIDQVLEQVAENIADINTPPDKAREVVVKIKIVPSARQFSTASVVVTSKLQPQEAQVVALILDKDTKGKSVLFESYADTNPNQHIFEGITPAEVRGTTGKSSATPFKAAASAGA